MPERTFFLSDLDMGIGARENLYRQRYHEGAIKAILRHIMTAASETRGLVLLRRVDAAGGIGTLNSVELPRI
jgi:hypothetical protein